MDFTRVPPAAALALLLLLALVTVDINCSTEASAGTFLSTKNSSRGGGGGVGAANASLPVPRKLMRQKGGDRSRKRPAKMGSEVCGVDDLLVYTDSTPPLPNGIPTYTVEIINACASGCAVADVHLRCGWFASYRLVNPRLFRRLRYDDCLVNDGRPIPSGGSVSFVYANSFSYDLAVAALSCV